MILRSYIDKYNRPRPPKGKERRGEGGRKSDKLTNEEGKEPIEKIYKQIKPQHSDDGAGIVYT